MNYYWIKDWDKWQQSFLERLCLPYPDKQTDILSALCYSKWKLFNSKEEKIDKEWLDLLEE